MKTVITTVTALAVLTLGTQRVSAGDREWATAGKILTGLVVGGAVARAFEPPPVYHAPPVVCAQPQVVYVQAPVVTTAPAPAPVYVQPSPAPVYFQPAPAPVVVYPAPVYYVRPAPVYYYGPRYYAPRFYAPRPYVSFGFRFGGGGGHSHHRGHR